MTSRTRRGVAAAAVTVVAAGVLAATTAPADAGIARTDHKITASCSDPGLSPMLPTAEFLLSGWGPPANPAGSLLSGVVIINGALSGWVSDMVGTWPWPMAGVGWNDVIVLALPGDVVTLIVDDVSATITC